MNNLRLLAGLLCAALAGGGVCRGQDVLTLEQLFECAETNSAYMRPSFSDELEAERGVSEARSRRLPDIDASLSVIFIGNGFITDRDYSNYQKAPIPHLGTGLGVTVNQPVYAGGAITKGIELAKIRSTAARYATDFRRDNIRFRITGLYLDLYKYMNLRRVVEANIRSARKLLDEMNARYDQGTALRNDITRYELLLANLELQLVRINNTVRILNDNLVTVAGLTENSIITPDTTLLARSLPVDSEQWWQREGEANAPALSLARTDVDACLTQESLIKADRLPKIGLQARWSLDGPILVEVPPINKNLSYWYVGVGVTYNIASLYKSNRSLARSRMATRKAREELETAREDLRLEVNAGHVRYLEAYEELKTRQKSVELAERNYDTTSMHYLEGMALITDMLDAADSRLDAQEQLVNARIDIIYYYYKLLFTTGRI